jgi:DNA polymerase III subunit epsilon
MGMNDMVRFVRQLTGRLGSSIYAGLQLQTNAQQTSFIRQLQKEMNKNNSLDIPLKELQVVVFDLETTGFFPDKGDKAISIGAVKMLGSDFLDKEEFYSLIKTDLAIPAEISNLTQISEQQLKNAPEASTVLMEFYRFIGSSILVAHHAKHEQAFIKKMSLDCLRIKFDHRIIDTSFLVRLFKPVSHPLPLEQLCHECGIVIAGRHHALADAKMAAEIWGHFLKKAQDHGYKNLREVYEHLSRLR